MCALIAACFSGFSLQAMFFAVDFFFSPPLIFFVSGCFPLVHQGDHSFFSSFIGLTTHVFCTLGKTKL